MREAVRNGAAALPQQLPTGNQPQSASTQVLFVDHFGAAKIEVSYRCTGPLGSDPKAQATVLRAQADALDPPPPDQQRHTRLGTPYGD